MIFAVIWTFEHFVLQNNPHLTFYTRTFLVAARAIKNYKIYPETSQKFPPIFLTLSAKYLHGQIIEEWGKYLSFYGNVVLYM